MKLQIVAILLVICSFQAFAASLIEENSSKTRDYSMRLENLVQSSLLKIQNLTQKFNSTPQDVDQCVDLTNDRHVFKALSLLHTANAKKVDDLSVHKVNFKLAKLSTSYTYLEYNLAYLASNLDKKLNHRLSGETASLDILQEWNLYCDLLDKAADFQNKIQNLNMSFATAAN